MLCWSCGIRNQMAVQQLFKQQQQQLIKTFSINQSINWVKTEKMHVKKRNLSGSCECCGMCGNCLPIMKDEKKKIWSIFKERKKTWEDFKSQFLVRFLAEGKAKAQVADTLANLRSVVPPRKKIGTPDRRLYTSLLITHVIAGANYETVSSQANSESEMKCPSFIAQPWGSPRGGLCSRVLFKILTLFPCSRPKFHLVPLLPFQD